MENEITAIIPTRSGSERVKNKNTRPFAGKSLLQIKIDKLVKLRESGYIHKIVVNTNCKKSIQIAKKYNLSIVIRDEYYASSDCPINEYWKEVLTKSIGTKYSMLCQVTSPLIKLESFKKCLNIFNKTNKPIMTVDPIKDYLWRTDRGKLYPANYNYPHHPKSQNLDKKFFRINFGVVIISKDDLIKYNNIMTPITTCIDLNHEESIDIDDDIDFKLAELIYLKNHSLNY